MTSQEEKDTTNETTTTTREDAPKASESKVSSSEETKPLDHTTQVTCDVLCSLMGSASSTGGCPDDDEEGMCDAKLACGGMGEGSRLCPKQMQLPMFLSKTYHMISRADSRIACWSESGDNFVIKNVDKFSVSVLPLYFKHSNFSSFARQLNFYGFRKMRSDPILTSDVDPQTAGHVRFFHDKFQRDKPELLQQIKRATKTDQQSKDEIDSLRQEVTNLRETLAATTTEYERRLAELSYDFNRRLSATTVEFDNLAALVHRLLASQGVAAPAPAATAVGRDALHSLSHIATLHQGHAGAPNGVPPPAGAFSLTSINAKRASEGTATQSPASSRPRLG